jgi:hypothetical protein
MLLWGAKTSGTYWPEVASAPPGQQTELRPIAGRTNDGAMGILQLDEDEMEDVIHRARNVRNPAEDLEVWTCIYVGRNPCAVRLPNEPCTPPTC